MMSGRGGSDITVIDMMMAQSKGALVCEPRGLRGAIAPIGTTEQ